MGTGLQADYPSQNYSRINYSVSLNWNNRDSFYGYSSTAGGSIVYNIGAGNVTIPISVNAPSSAGDGSRVGSVTLASGSLDIPHAANGSINSVTGSAYYNNGLVGNLTASDYVGNLVDFVRVPSAPSSMSASNVGNVINVSWPEASAPFGPVTYYWAYRSSSNGGASWSTWSGDTVTSGLSFSGTYTLGLTYQFKVYAHNSDGDSSTTYSNTVFLAAGGKRFQSDVAGWALTTTAAKRYTGSAWTDITTAKRFDGSNWVNLS